MEEAAGAEAAAEGVEAEVAPEPEQGLEQVAQELAPEHPVTVRDLAA